MAKSPIHQQQHSSINALNTELYDFDKVLRRFKQINAIRLDRTHKMLTERQKDFLTLLPFIFHVNHPSLPGFSTSTCPVGIAGFSATAQMKIIARRMAKGYEFRNKAYHQHDILSIFFMGSPGTIAYSQASDFDIWLCHREDLNVKQLEELSQKAKLVMQWAEEINLDCTIFLVNPKEFRDGKYTPLSNESSGSTQQLLLLEEFYRTAILIAGKYPIWWIVPPEEESNYEIYVDNLESKRLIFSADYINLGSIDNIPADEFFGATLWHIYKGIDSPYKSLLKLLLMEAYAVEFPHIKLLSVEYKKHIYQDKEIKIDEIDPYILMLNKLTNYLNDQQSQERLDLIRQCFYLKAHCSITKIPKHKEDTWQISLMKSLVATWGWNDYSIRMLDHQSNWKIDDIISEQKKLVDALTNSYKKLSDFFRQFHNTSRVSQRDLHILGRKLYAAFEKKAGKIEIVNLQHSTQILETHITFHQFKSPKNKLGWKLFIGVVGLNEVAIKEPIKQSAHLMKLICWLYFNKVINQHTKFLVFDLYNSRMNDKEVIDIINSLMTTYPDNLLPSASTNVLSKPSTILNSKLFINVANDPFKKSKKNISQMATSRTDSFKYGGLYQNLVISIDLIFNTSWKEMMHFHYSGTKGVLDCICHILRWNNKPDQKLILPSSCQSFSSPRGGAIGIRVLEVIKDIILSFKTVNYSSQRYVFAIEKSYFFIYFRDNEPSYEKLNTYTTLLNKLTVPSRKFNSLAVEKFATDDLILPAIYKYNKPNQVQFFYFNHIKNVDIYILDDFGDLYYQRLAIEEQNVHINHYILFLSSIINRLQFDAFRDMTMGFENVLELSIYQMTRHLSELLVRKQKAKQFPLPKQFLKIQVIGDPKSISSSQYFSIFCGDEEFSSLEHGDQIYHKLADFVVKQRPSGLRYPIYITDMDLSVDLTEPGGQQSTHIVQLLKYKQDIEKKLNTAIKQI
jgi:adenylate cyclase, class 1